MFNLKNQLTLWGPRNGISDYAVKSWAGLWVDYYAPRWKLFVLKLADDLLHGVPYNQSKLVAEIMDLLDSTVMTIAAPTVRHELGGGTTAMQWWAAGYTLAQSGKTAREPQFDNAEVKVWKSLVLPNDPLPLHRHEHPRVIVALHGGTMKILEDSGSSQTYEWQTGKAYWLPANPPGTHHQDINIGDKPIETSMKEFLALGIDGFFTDFPITGYAVRNDVEHGGE